MSELVIFETNGEQVAFDPQASMWSMTAMHRAAGAPANKEPAQWLRGAHAKEFIEALAARLSGEGAALFEKEIAREVFRDADLNVHQSHIYDEQNVGVSPPDTKALRAQLIQTRRGRYGSGTWAHWQIAAAYAHYLNPLFYIQWNEWALSYRLRHAQTNQPAHLADHAELDQLTARVAALEALQEYDRSLPPPDIPKPPPLTRRATNIEELSAIELSDLSQPATILAILRAANGAMQPHEIVAVMERAGVLRTRPTQVSVNLQRLVHRGWVRRVSRGFYAA